MKKTKRKAKDKRGTRRIKELDYGKLELPKRVHTYHEKTELIHENPFQANESIVKSIVDKIITLSVRASYNKSLEKVFQKYYCDYVLTQLNSLLATKHLFYYDEPENEKRQNIFWNKHFDKSNTWIEITEPNSSKIDRYENVFMSYVCYIQPQGQKIEKKKNYISRSNTLKEGNLISNNNKNELIDMQIRTDSSKKYSVKLKKVLNKDGQNKILDILEEKSSVSSLDEEVKEKSLNKNSKLTKNIKQSIRKSLKNTQSPSHDKAKNNVSKFISSQNDFDPELNIEDDIIINKKSKKQPILPLNYKEIPDIEKEFDFDKFSPPEVNRLRKEIEEEKIRKEKEAKKKAIIKKITINNENNDDNKIKIIDSNKLTFDSNGKIINFKPIKIDTLSRDFALLKNEIKSSDTNFEAKKTSNRKKRNNKSKEPPKGKMQKEKEIVAKNPEDDPNGINKFNFVKISHDKSEQIIPSGSNFSLMLPNIGVILKENNQVKEGNREFGKYFKKYSLGDYDRILRDYLPLQNKTMLKNKLGQSTHIINNMNLTSINKKIPLNHLINTNTSYKYNSTNSLGNNNTSLNNIHYNLPLTQTQNFNGITELTNPLMNQQEIIQENDNNNSIINNNSSFLKTNKLNASYIFSGNNLYSLSKLQNISNYSEAGLIRLNKNCSTNSLKNEIENLKDLNRGSNINFYPPKEKLKTRNIFNSNYKEFFKNKRNKDIKDDSNTENNMNELNKKIIMSGGWGTQMLHKNNSTGNLLFSKHLTKYQALRELGSNLLNGIKVKLPRERKVDINI